MNSIRLFFSIFIGTILFNCSNPNVTGPGGEGNGSETIARGVIIDSTGTPAAGVLMHLLPANFNPVTDDTDPEKLQTVTDSDGEYRFERIDSGTYNLEAGSASTGLKALITGIECSGKKDSVDVDTARLRKTGSVIVNLKNMTPRNGDYLYLPGTNTFSVISSRDSISQHAMLNDVPAGTFADLIYVTSNDSLNVNIIEDSLVVHSGDTVASEYALWLYSAKLILNTGVTGSDVQEDVYDFPVLIRLTDAQFEFSRARTDGKDIRFTTSDGFPLVFEIERWDPVAGRAEVWVRVDTVHGNDSLQYITMYWGNPDAVDGSNSAHVFDTATGFQGVWHLTEPANSNSFDATANRYHGTPSDTAPLSVQGVIGNARAFNGISNGIRMEGTAASTLNFNENDRYTLSAWVYSDMIDEKWHFIAGKGPTQYYLKQQVESKYGNWEFVEFHDREAWQMSITPAVAGTWKLLTGVRDGDRQYLYLDGELVDSTIKQNTDAATTVRNTAEDFTIGRHQEYVTYLDEGYCLFDGQIDEVRISSVVRSVGWIRLCYMNQREDNKLVLFKEK